MGSQWLYSAQHTGKFPSISGVPQCLQQCVFLSLCYNKSLILFLWKTLFKSFSGINPFFHWVSLSWNQIWWTLQVNPRRLQMFCSALVHMAVKYWKFRGSKYNWETASGQRKGPFSCWVPEGHLCWYLQVWGTLWWKLLSESPPLTPAKSKPCLLPQGMMFCCHSCTEGQGSWAGFVFLSPLSRVCGGPWSS